MIQRKIVLRLVLYNKPKPIRNTYLIVYRRCMIILLLENLGKTDEETNI